MAAVVVRIAQRVGHEHARRAFGRGAGQCQRLGIDAQLRHCKWAELKLEGDEALQRRFDRGGDCARAFVGRDRGGNMPQHAKHKGAGAGGRVSHCHALGRDAAWQTEPRPPQRFIDQANHAADDLWWRVVRTRELAQVVVVDLEEVFVEVQPGVAATLADFRPVDHIEHALQGPQRGGQRLARFFAVGQKLQGRADQRRSLLQLLGNQVHARSDGNAACPCRE